MKAIHEAAGQDLQWSGKQEGLFTEEEFALRSGDEALALLHAREKGTDWICGEQPMGVGPYNAGTLVLERLSSFAS